MASGLRRWFDSERSFLREVKRGPRHWSRLMVSSLVLGLGMIAFGVWRVFDGDSDYFLFFAVFGLIQIAQVRLAWLMSGGARYHGRVEMKEWESLRQKLASMVSLPGS